MLGFGMGEILIIAVVVLIVVGPDKLPQFARSAGRLYGQVRRTADEMRRALVLEADRQDADERYRLMRERRARAEAERAAAEAANPGVSAQDEHLPGAPAPEAEGALEGGAEGGAVADQPAHATGDHGDADLQALLNDPNGPYAAGRPLDEVDLAKEHLDVHQAQTPTPAADGELMTGPALPPGVSAEEWAELPQHIRDLLSAREDRA